MKKPIFAGKAKVSQLQRIAIKTGRKPCECKCKLCQMQCRTPCLGTPQDILKLIDAGYVDRLAVTDWAAGILMGVISRPIPMIQAIQIDKSDLDPKARCTFFHDGLCELHDKGLKPTEGRLSHHSHRIDNFKASRSISWAVAQEWLDPANLPVIDEIARKFSEYVKSK